MAEPKAETKLAPASAVTVAEEDKVDLVTTARSIIDGGASVEVSDKASADEIAQHIFTSSIASYTVEKEEGSEGYKVTLSNEGQLIYKPESQKSPAKK